MTFVVKKYSPQTEEIKTVVHRMTAAGIPERVYRRVDKYYAMNEVNFILVLCTY